MSDIADLGFRVDTTGIKKGERALNDLGKSGDNAEKSGAKLSKTYLAAGAVVAGALTKSMLIAIKFEKAMAEVSTLVDTSAVSMDGLAESVKGVNAEFGGGLQQQAKALYGIISSGAEAGAESTAILTQANKLALGGVTDLETAADGLTSALNAYGAGADEATAYSDTMFIAMKAGKTTIGELSAVVGQTAPIASQLGVSFDELEAAISTLTTTGLKTAQAGTQIQAAFTSILKPTSEASKLAEELGLNFNSQALEAQGLAGFLAEVREKTGGNKDAMAQLFGSVEAVKAVMALTGQQAGTFAAILEDMGNKAGETDLAMTKMGGTSAAQWDIMAGKAENAANAFGKLFLPVLSLLVDAITPIPSYFAKVSLAMTDAAWAVREFVISIKQMGTDGVQALTDFVAEFIRVGEELVQGLIDGITAKVSEVKAAVVGVGEDVLGWFKDVFEIQSPSRVMYEMGENLNLGLADGLVDTSGVVIDAAGDVAESALGAFGDTFSQGLEGVFRDVLSGGSLKDSLKGFGKGLLGSVVGDISGGITDKIKDVFSGGLSSVTGGIGKSLGGMFGGTSSTGFGGAQFAAAGNGYGGGATGAMASGGGAGASMAAAGPLIAVAAVAYLGMAANAREAAAAQQEVQSKFLEATGIIETNNLTYGEWGDEGLIQVKKSAAEIAVMTEAMKSVGATFEKSGNGAILMSGNIEGARQVAERFNGETQAALADQLSALNEITLATADAEEVFQARADNAKSVGTAWSNSLKLINSTKFDGVVLEFKRLTGISESAFRKISEDGLVTAFELAEHLGWSAEKIEDSLGGAASTSVINFLKMETSGTDAAGNIVSAFDDVIATIADIPTEINTTHTITQRDSDLSKVGSSSGFNDQRASGTFGQWMTVPPGFNNDDFTVGMKSNEKYKVMTPGESDIGNANIERQLAEIKAAINNNTANRESIVNRQQSQSEMEEMARA